MPFLMIRNDITKVAADAIVNPANRNLLQGSGTSRAIYQAAGEQELTAACEAIGHCSPGGSGGGQLHHPDRQGRPHRPGVPHLAGGRHRGAF